MKSFRVDRIKTQKSQKTNLSELGNDIFISKDYDLKSQGQRDNSKEDVKTAYSYQGDNKKLVFLYYGLIDNVRDRFPLMEEDEILKDELPRFDFPVRKVTVNVQYSAGVLMWLLSQSSILKVLEPEDVLTDIQDRLKTSYKQYFPPENTKKDGNWLLFFYTLVINVIEENKSGYGYAKISRTSGR